MGSEGGICLEDIREEIREEKKLRQKKKNRKYSDLLTRFFFSPVPLIVAYLSILFHHSRGWKCITTDNLHLSITVLKNPFPSFIPLCLYSISFILFHLRVSFSLAFSSSSDPASVSSHICHVSHQSNVLSHITSTCIKCMQLI